MGGGSVASCLVGGGEGEEGGRSLNLCWVVGGGSFADYTLMEVGVKSEPDASVSISQTHDFMK